MGNVFRVGYNMGRLEQAKAQANAAAQDQQQDKRQRQQRQHYEHEDDGVAPKQEEASHPQNNNVAMAQGNGANVIAPAYPPPAPAYPQPKWLSFVPTQQMWMVGPRPIMRDPVGRVLIFSHFEEGLWWYRYA
jgi:hypothetical protein